MAITARITCTKNANYTKQMGVNNAAVPQQRQIVRYYDVSSTSMDAIAKIVNSIKAYLDKTLTVAILYPNIANDPTVSEWKEDPWMMAW